MINDTGILAELLCLLIGSKEFVNDDVKWHAQYNDCSLPKTFGQTSPNNSLLEIFFLFV
jgi:hypothetical protein